MPPVAMDSIASFQFLVDNVQSWKESMAMLTTYSAQKHSEFVAEYLKLLDQTRPRRRKTPSVSSIHSADDETPVPQPTEPNDSAPLETPQPTEISPFEPGYRYLYAQANRKRKGGTSLRSGASGPCKYRNKQMTIIYYDSHIQSELDKVVKGFGSARNNLRKGKTSYRASKGFQLPPLGKYSHLLNDDGLDGFRSGQVSRASPVPPSSKPSTTPSTPNPSADGEECFDKADKDLDVIQRLCETAAHQALRDGDCKTELETAVKNLDELSAFAESALTKFKAEAAAKDGDDKHADKIEGDLLSSLVAGAHSTSTKSFAMNLYPPTHPTGASPMRSRLSMATESPTLTPDSSAIEVDDDEDASIDLDLSHFRRAHASRVRA